MFSELDEALLPWLPYIISILLGAWLLYGAGEATEEAEENPQGDAEMESPKPLPIKKAARATKPTVATLIAEESRKRSK
jgi:hypothetical protein